jgi:uncharacterized protein (TIGR03435 family)
MIGKILLAGFVCAGIAMAQSPNPPKAAAPMTPAAAKVYAFDVVSIRHNISEENGDIGKVTADGYRMINNLVYVVIRTAYLPQTAGSTHYSLGQMKGLPGWVNTEKYDLDARISGEDRAAWQNPAEQKAMLQSMLQTMLVERCKLAVHREIKEGPVYMLVVDRGGPKFKVTDPTVEHPGGMPMPWGGVLFPGGMNGDGMRMYGASMTTFASYVSSILSNMGLKEVTVQDKTGLTGKYDITIKRPAPSESAPGEQQDGTAASDPGGISIYSRLKDLGLMLESGEGQVETLVIDHIERPSAN